MFFFSEGKWRSFWLGFVFRVYVVYLGCRRWRQKRVHVAGFIAMLCVLLFRKCWRWIVECYVSLYVIDEFSSVVWLSKYLSFKKRGTQWVTWTYFVCISVWLWEISVPRCRRPDRQGCLDWETFFPSSVPSKSLISQCLEYFALTYRN